jgi:hypothetical protein
MSVLPDLHLFTSSEVTGPLLSNSLWQPTCKHLRNGLQFEPWYAHIIYYTSQFRNSVASDVCDKCSGRMALVSGMWCFAGSWIRALAFWRRENCQLNIMKRDTMPVILFANIPALSFLSWTNWNVGEWSVDIATWCYACLIVVSYWCCRNMVSPLWRNWFAEHMTYMYIYICVCVCVSK